MNLMQKTVSAVLTCAMLAACIPVHAAAETDKTPAGLSVSEIGDKIAAYAEENPNDYVSFETAVFCKDEIVYTGAFGYADRGAQKKADENTVYEWGSVSKTMIWVSVMQLFEQGKLDLDADVRGYLPDGFFRHLRYDDPITMLDLMNHSAGWCENTWSIQTPEPGEITSLHDALQSSEPYQAFRPGEMSSYSNWGAALAAYIVECVSGTDYCEYVHQHIFEPLGMEHTAINPTHSDNAWVQSQRESLHCYAQTGETQWDAIGQQLVYINLYPAGAVTGTISDMAKYAQSFVTDSCPLFEKAETRGLLLSQSAVLPDTDIPFCYHGFWNTNYENATVIGHNGGTNGCSANLQFDPESGFGAVVLMNGAGVPGTRIMKIVFGEMRKETVSGDSAENTDISGLYLGVRGVLHGTLKPLSLVGVLPITPAGADSYSVAGIAQIDRVSGSIFRLTQGDIVAPAVGKTLPDGTRMFTLGNQSYLSDSTVFMSLIALLLYVLLAVVSLILLIVKLIQRIAKKRKQYIGRGMMTLAQLAKLVSPAVLIWLLSGYSDRYGITKMNGYIGCAVQGICMLIFVLTVCTSLRGLFSKSEEKAGAAKYIFNILGNGAAAFAVTALELFRFWNV